MSSFIKKALWNNSIATALFKASRTFPPEAIQQARHNDGLIPFPLLEGYSGSIVYNKFDL
jgi:hypothetical protein